MSNQSQTTSLINECNSYLKYFTIPSSQSYQKYFANISNLNEQLEEDFKSKDQRFLTNLKDYLENSLKLNNLEKLNNSYNDLNDLQKEKLNSLKDELDDLDNKQLNSIRNYQVKDYKSNELSFYNSVILIFLLLIVIIFILASLVNMNLVSNFNLFRISFTLGIIFIIYLLINLKQNMYRRKYDWNKFYFVYNKPKNTL